MIEKIAEASWRPRARTTGVVYLLFFLTAISADLFIRGLVVSSDAAITANNILVHQSLFRLHFAGGLMSTAFYIALTALFYGLFKPVNRTLALLATFFSLSNFFATFKNSVLPKIRVVDYWCQNKFPRLPVRR